MLYICLSNTIYFIIPYVCLQVKRKSHIIYSFIYREVASTRVFNIFISISIFASSPYIGTTSYTVILSNHSRDQFKPNLKSGQRYKRNKTIPLKCLFYFHTYFQQKFIWTLNKLENSI